MQRFRFDWLGRNQAFLQGTFTGSKNLSWIRGSLRAMPPVRRKSLTGGGPVAKAAKIEDYMSLSKSSKGSDPSQPVCLLREWLPSTQRSLCIFTIWGSIWCQFFPCFPRQQKVSTHNDMHAYFAQKFPTQARQCVALLPCKTIVNNFDSTRRRWKTSWPGLTLPSPTSSRAGTGKHVCNGWNRFLTFTCFSFRQYASYDDFRDNFAGVLLRPWMLTYQQDAGLKGYVEPARDSFVHFSALLLICSLLCVCWGPAAHAHRIDRRSGVRSL